MKMIMKKKNVKIIFFLAIWLIFMSTFVLNQCTSRKSYISEEKNGIQIIHNKFPAYEKSPISLHFVRQYGEFESEN